MKRFINYFNGLLITVGFIAVLSLLHAQEAAAPVQNGTSTLATLANEDVSSLSDFEVELKALELLPTIPAINTPQAGTFWSAQHAPGSGSEWPPLPANIRGVPFWNLGDGIYLLDDRLVNYNLPIKTKTKVQSGGGIHAMDVPSVPGSGGGDDSDDDSGGGSYITPFSTNGLWLQITGCSNGFANLILHNTTNNVEYEILSQPALGNGTPVSSWNSEVMFWGSSTTNWTAVTVPQNGRTNLFFDARSWQDSTGSGIPDWWWLEYFGQDTNVDAYADPEGDGWNNLQKFQNGMNPNLFYTPPVPTGFYAYTDTTGTNILFSWNPSPGAVQHYIIGEYVYDPDTGNYNYQQVTEVSGSTTSFEGVGAFDPFNENDYYNYYVVQAVYAGGSSPASGGQYVNPSPPLPPNANINITASLVRNATGHWQLMFSSIPSSVATLKLHWHAYDYWYDIDWGSYDWEIDVPASSLTNGVYLIPDSQTTNQIGSYGGFFGGAYGFIAYVQPVDVNTNAGNMVFAGFLPLDAPCFVDGRQHLKQNLLFELRAATLTQPLDAYGISSDTNYAESSIFRQDYEGKTWLNGAQEYTAMDDLWPFNLNYQLHQSLYDPSNPGVPSSFVWHTNLVSVPAPAVLGIGDPYWISQGLGNPPDLAASTNSGIFSLSSGAHNLFGLAFATALVNQGGTNYGVYPPQYNPPITVASGGSTAMTNVNCFFSQTADPVLLTNGYYFAPVTTPGTLWPQGAPLNQSVPIPVNPRFAVTNQTGLMIASVGSSTVIGAWAKYSVQGSSPTKYAYLGQYFTNAFRVDANGNVTTNAAGILSSYGEFFPTNVGAVAVVTMPDIDTGQQATGIVQVISLNVDANHDGTMDFTYGGPDFVSSSKPFHFWINDDADNGDDIGDGIPGQGAGADGVTQVQVPIGVPYYGTVMNVWEVHGRRDLVDYFPVYLNIGGLFQSNALSAGISATDTNYEFVLSQADGALRYASTDLTATNYMNFLQDTNESGSLASAQLTTIPAGGVALPTAFLSGIATNNQGVILVEAWTNTTQPLVLTIFHGTNQIAQTQLYLSISGVEQMFRQKNLLLNTTSGDFGLPADRLTDASVPNEPDTIQKNFVFVHGYNVNPNQARGWDADIYKRLYWSGSHAKFYGVTWEASDSQIAGQVTINLQTNIVNAFNTAPSLNTFLNSLSGTNVVAAHSLGNMLVLSTLNDCTNQSISTYFMIDAAVSIEAIDSGATSNPDMYPTAWTNYTGNLWASDSYALFPTNDYRNTLTWRGRLSNLQNADVYNFYSSGEEVLRDYSSDPPTSLIGIAVGQLVSLWEGDTGEYTWAWQEKLKGLMPANGLLSSDHGGWQFNEAYGTNIDGGGVVYWEPMSPAAAATLTTPELQTNAFFNWASPSGSFFPFTSDLALQSSSGSSYAQANRNRILSDAIPCLTLPVGANPVPRLQPPESPFQMNFDMQASYENGWAADRPTRTAGVSAAGEWHHSDVRAVAYTFTYKLFNQMVTVGNLK